MHFNPKQWPFIERLHLSSFLQLLTCQRVAWRSKRLKQHPCFSTLLSHQPQSCIGPIYSCCSFYWQYTLNTCLLHTTFSHYFSIQQHSLLVDSKMNFEEESNVWWTSPRSAPGGCFCSMLSNIKVSLISPPSWRKQFYRRGRVFISGSISPTSPENRLYFVKEGKDLSACYTSVISW